MHAVICYLSMVPDVIWAALIASLLTLGGVFLTNRHFSRRQEAQLKHEKEQQETARKFELRQSVYLSAAEELTLASQHLMNLASIDIAKNNPADNLTSFFVATTKACLVASDDTAKAINELLEAYSKIFFSLLAKTIPIQDARIERNIQNDAYERFQAEVNRILATMTQLSEEAKADSTIQDALTKSLDFNMEQSSIAADARSKAWGELNKLKKEFMKQAFSEMKTIMKLTVPALVAIRAELGIPSDIDAYRADSEARFSRVEKQIDKVLAELGDESA